jgi:organic hydroperoxide reductase OsmC/OhrA
MPADSLTAVAHVQLVEGYRFTATFPKVPGAGPITLDEAAPLGTGTGPTPTDMLGAAVGACLSASLTLCLNEAHLEPDAVNGHVTTHLERNEAGRLRVGRIDVELTPCFAISDEGRFERCKAVYQDLCAVTSSIRRGIPVNVRMARCGDDVKRVAGEASPRTASAVGVASPR